MPPWIWMFWAGNKYRHDAKFQPGNGDSYSFYLKYRVLCYFRLLASLQSQARFIFKMNWKHNLGALKARAFVGQN